MSHVVKSGELAAEHAYGARVTDETARRAAVMNELRVQRCLRVGAVTIAGSHAEYALQRLAHVGSGGSRWNNLDTTVPVSWSELNTELRRQIAAKPDDDIRRRIGELLDWAATKKLWKSRNNIVHADWLDAPSRGLSGRRLMRDGTSATIITSHTDLDSLVNSLNELTRRIYELLDELTPGPQPWAEWVWPDDL
jgi:hypothetical protein